MELIAQRLFEWWQSGGDSTSLFKPGFLFRGVSKAVAGEDWLYLSRHGVPWTDVTPLAIVGDRSWGATVFEGLDPVTGLKHRLSWLIRATDDRIEELIETAQIVE